MLAVHSSHKTLQNKTNVMDHIVNFYCWKLQYQIRSRRKRLRHTQCVPLANKPGISLIINNNLTIIKWRPFPAHVMMSHSLHNEVSPFHISLQYPH